MIYSIKKMQKQGGRSLARVVVRIDAGWGAARTAPETELANWLYGTSNEGVGLCSVDTSTEDHELTRCWAVSEGSTGAAAAAVPWPACTWHQRLEDVGLQPDNSDSPM